MDQAIIRPSQSLVKGGDPVAPFRGTLAARRLFLRLTRVLRLVVFFVVLRVVGLILRIIRVLTFFWFLPLMDVVLSMRMLPVVLVVRHRWTPYRC